MYLDPCTSYVMLHLTYVCSNPDTFSTLHRLAAIQVVSLALGYYPGYFRTNFLSSDSIKTAAEPIAAYAGARASEQAHLNDINGNQPNDPVRAAEILIELSERPAPPVHLFLGKDAYAVANAKIELIQQTMAEYKTLGTSTDIN